MPSQWSNLESLVNQLGSLSRPSDAETANDSSQPTVQRQLSPQQFSQQSATRLPTQQPSPPQPTPRPLPAQGTDNSTVHQQTDNSAGSAVPQQWSNLEDFVMRLQADSSKTSPNPTPSSNPTPSPQASAKATSNKKPPSKDSPQAQLNRTHSTASDTATPSSPQPSSRPQPIVVDNPPAVTIRRKGSSSAQSTVIQARGDAVSPSRKENNKSASDAAQDYGKYMELLAQEVYSLLRQRLSLEQERHGPRYPR